MADLQDLPRQGDESDRQRSTYRSTRRSRRKARSHSRSRAQRWRRRAFGVIVAFIVAIPATAGASWWYLHYRLDQRHSVTLPASVLHHAKPGDPFNVLLVGSDSRSFVGTNSNRFGSGSVVTGQRSDVVIIARIVPKTHQVYLLSIPRDTWVNIPGNVAYISGQNRINAAFNSGPGLLIKTIKQNFGIPVDHFAEINFAGFQDMVQAVGGLRINFPYKVKDPYTGLSIMHTGCQQISGGMSLAYVRSRHLEYFQNGQWNYDYGSDWSRIRRQDVFFHALLAQVKGQLLNPIAMNSLLVAVVHNLTTDSTVTNSLLISLGWNFRHLSSADIHSEVLPTVPYVTSGGADVLLPARYYDTKMIQSFLAFGTTPAASSTTTTAPASTGSSSPTTSTSSTTTTTTAPPSSSSVVFDTQPEPWNGTPC